MNFLGLVLSSSSLFQQTDPHTSLERNDLKPNCPVADILKPLKNKTREASQGIKCQDHPSDYDYSRRLNGISNPSCTPSTLSHDESVKKISKKKKRRKGKSQKLNLDSNVAVETADITKISCSTGLVERNPSNGAVCNQIAKEVINKSVHVKVDAELHRILLKSTLNHEGSNHSDNNKFDGTCNMNFTRTQENSTDIVRDSSVITSPSASELMSVLEDARDGNARTASTISPALDKSHLVKEADKREINVEPTSSNQCSGVCEVPEAESIQNSEQSKENSQITNSAYRIPSRMNNRKKSGQENANFTWQRTGRCIGSSPAYVTKNSDHHLCMNASSSDTSPILKHINSTGDGLLPPPHLPHYCKDGFQQKVQHSRTSVQKMYDSQGHELIDTYAREAGESFHGRHGQYVLRTRRYEIMGISSWEMSKNKLTVPFKQENKHKWIPVGKKDALMLKPSRDIDHANIGKVNQNQEANNEAVCGTSAVLGIIKEVDKCKLFRNSIQGNSGNNKNDNYLISDYKSKNFPIYICSDEAEQALGVSYTLQIASESFQLATGSPIAEFEKLLISASPVITPSFLLGFSLSEFSKPCIALRDVWNWYEGPGNFGLQIKVEDFRTPNGLEADVSFHAHFVPFISAIQLFGHPHHSACPSDASHVIFEYFEHEPPQHRKPLFTKIKELLEVGISNSAVFGDQSKLDCTDLRELNPASWYSVAWYPIYRIPEGCFRASFLTYHSLGHLYLRNTKSDCSDENALSIVFPALGMQSYNAQGECWFHPRKPAKYIHKDIKPFDASELLEERLRVLEETAALFSRGHVLKDNITAANRHPDYEFFLSRRR